MGYSHERESVADFITNLTNIHSLVEKLSSMQPRERQTQPDVVDDRVDKIVDKTSDALRTIEDTLETYENWLERLFKLPDNKQREHETGAYIRRLQKARSSLEILQTRLSLQYREVMELCEDIGSGQITSTLEKQEINSIEESLKWVDCNSSKIWACIRHMPWRRETPAQRAARR
jgi:hypothetical protein